MLIIVVYIENCNIISCHNHNHNHNHNHSHNHNHIISVISYHIISYHIISIIIIMIHDCIFPTNTPSLTLININRSKTSTSGLPTQFCSSHSALTARPYRNRNKTFGSLGSHVSQSIFRPYNMTFLGLHPFGPHN